MADLEEAVLVKAHLGRTGKRRRNGVGLSDLIVFGVLFGLFAAAVYFLFKWVKAGGWVFLSGGLLGFCVVFSLIRWRRYIFGSGVWTAHGWWAAGRDWERLKRGDYPLWLLYALYETQYGHKQQTVNRVGGDSVIVYGARYEYRVDLKDPWVAEPAAKLSNLVASVSKRLR